MSQDASQNAAPDQSQGEAPMSPPSNSPVDAMQSSASFAKSETGEKPVGITAPAASEELKADGTQMDPIDVTETQSPGSEGTSTASPLSWDRLVPLLQQSAGEWLARVKMPPSARTMRLVAATCSALLLIALLPVLLNASHHNVGAASAPPTATTVPTVTQQPSPTAMSGYQPLVDSEDGFVIQYPLNWTCSSSNPGIDCIDSPAAQNYRLQVQLPGSWTGADTGQHAGDASVWVDYALNAFSNVPGRTYQRLTDANQSAVIGGVTWSGGAAVIGIEPDSGSGSATVTPTTPLVLIRVQVYATLYNNRPYIIALYAADDQYASGSSRYFQPMLNSFAFLPSGNVS